MVIAQLNQIVRDHRTQTPLLTETDLQGSSNPGPSSGGSRSTYGVPHVLRTYLRTNEEVRAEWLNRMCCTDRELLMFLREMKPNLILQVGAISIKKGEKQCIPPFIAYPCPLARPVLSYRLSCRYLESKQGHPFHHHHH